MSIPVEAGIYYGDRPDRAEEASLVRVYQSVIN